MDVCANVRLIAVGASLVCFWPADPVGAQPASDCAQEQDADLRAQCEDVVGQRAKQDRAQPPAPLAAIPRQTPPMQSPAPPPQPPPQGPSQVPPPQGPNSQQPSPPAGPFDLQGRLSEACGVLLPPSSGVPGERAVILVAHNRRAIIDRELQRPEAPAAEVEAVNADVCFEVFSSGRLLVKPYPPSDGIQSFTLDWNNARNQWLFGLARSGRVKLVPSSDCADLLRELKGRGVVAPSAWVEEGEGLSRCEPDANGQPRVDPAKTSGYGGVVIVMGPRG